MNPQPQRRRSKRLAAYEEEDGDFKFTRGSKRTKTKAEPQAEAPVPVAEASRSRSKVEDEARGEKKPKRRKMSFSTPKQDDVKAPKRTGRTTRASLERSRTGDDTTVDETEADSIDMLGGASGMGEEASTMVETNHEATKIFLPFSDTPVINRNKELRRRGTGGRRSSLGMRGRRASSLIDNGHSATPHDEVDSAEFYKLIASDGLSEPRRMKQLLIWCGERALAPKPAFNDPASSMLNAARPIMEALLKDFASKSNMTDWFHREDSAPTTIVKIPNPLNIENAAKIQELEELKNRLQAEKAQWTALTRPPPPILPFPNLTSPPSPSDLDPSLLDAESAAILSHLQTSSSQTLLTAATKRVKSVQDALEFQVDQFADNVHKLEQTTKTMDRVASRVMALSAVRLEEREKEEKEKVGTRDLPIQEVLRELSRIMPESGGR